MFKCKRGNTVKKKVFLILKRKDIRRLD